MAPVHLPPRHVIHDMKSPRGGAALSVVAIAWLVGRHLTTGLGGELEEIDAIAAMIPPLIALVLLVGPRRIEIDDDEIRVFRRGKEVFRRPLGDVAGVSGFLIFTRLRFKTAAVNAPTGWCSACARASPLTARRCTCDSGMRRWSERSRACHEDPRPRPDEDTMPVSPSSRSPATASRRERGTPALANLVELQLCAVARNDGASVPTSTGTAPRT